MKPCILIKGTDDRIEEFENEIALALKQGYEISGDLITHVISNTGGCAIVLLQPMFLSDESYNDNDNF
ncbi:MAG TPA: hypothetical protein V7791_01780 [Candidatus Azoamicus sp. OHIO1]